MLVVVVDAVDKVFAKTGLTGSVEPDLASKPAIGDPGVAEANQLLHVFADGPIAPQGGVHLVEASAELWMVAEHGPDRRRLTVDGRWEHGGSGHQRTPSGSVS